LAKIRLSPAEKLTLISNLASMLSAGIPLLEVIDSLLEEAKGGQKKVLVTLRADVKEGQKLATTLDKFPESFDPVTVNLIKAAEEAGTLDQTLHQLVESIEKEIEFSDKVKAALVYPVLIVVVFIAVVLFILVFAVPKFSDTFARLNIDLPLPTKILFLASSVLLKYPIYIGLGAGLLLIGFYLIFTQKSKFFMNVLFSLPILSKLARSIDLTRFARSLSLLLSSGIPIVEALELCRNVVYKKEVEEAIIKAKESVVEGKRLAVGLSQVKGIIPSMMIRIIESGEKSGSLEKSMADIAKYFDNRVTSNVKNITTLLEPALLIIIALVVGLTYLAIIAPIYQLLSQIKS